MNYREVMDLPISVFWLMDSCIPRLRAEQDLRSLSIASCAQSGEAIKQIRESLVIEMGEVMKLDPIASAYRDEKGIQELKAMVQAPR